MKPDVWLSDGVNGNEVRDARRRRRGLVIRRLGVAGVAALLIALATFTVQRRSAALDNDVKADTAYQIRVPVGFTANVTTQNVAVNHPDQMRMVIERVALTGDALPNGQVWRIQIVTTVNGNKGTWPLPPIVAGAPLAGQPNLVANIEMVGVYADGGPPPNPGIPPALFISVGRNNLLGGFANATPMLTISGHLVPL